MCSLSFEEIVIYRRLWIGRVCISRFIKDGQSLWPVVDWVDKHTLPDSWKECLETQRKRTHLEADCHEMKFEEITFTNMRISMLYCINIETVWEYQDSAEKYLWQTYPTTRIPNSSVRPSRKMCPGSGSPCGQERLNSNSRVAFDHQIVIIIIKIVFRCRNEKKWILSPCYGGSLWWMEAWVTRPERPKGAKDEVKQARRAKSRSEGPPARSRAPEGP